jgi:hypothetical protein
MQNEVKLVGGNSDDTEESNSQRHSKPGNMVESNWEPLTNVTLENCYRQIQKYNFVCIRIWHPVVLHVNTRYENTSAVNTTSVLYFKKRVKTTCFKLPHQVIFRSIYVNTLKKNYNMYMTLVILVQEIQISCSFYIVNILCYIKLYKSTYHHKCWNSVQ